MKSLLVILFCILGCSIACAETVSVRGLQGLDETRYHRLESATLERGYDILVGLPRDYDVAQQQTYPTIYILDGGELYPLLRSYYNYLRNSEEVPASILVGISYGSRDYADGNQRGHDFTAPSSEREYYGGAADFQTFLSDELLPFIEANIAHLPTSALSSASRWVANSCCTPRRQSLVFSGGISPAIRHCTGTCRSFSKCTAKRRIRHGVHGCLWAAARTTSRCFAVRR